MGNYIQQLSLPGWTEAPDVADSFFRAFLKSRIIGNGPDTSDGPCHGGVDQNTGSLDG